MAKKTPAAQTSAAAVDRTSQPETAEKRIQDLKSQVTSLKDEIERRKKSKRESKSKYKTTIADLETANANLETTNANLKIANADLKHRMTLCKAFILSMYFYPGHIADMTRINNGGSGRDRSQAFKDFQVHFKNETGKHEKGDMSSGAPVTGDGNNSNSRWVVRGDHLMAEYPQLLEEYLESVKKDKALMKRARAFQAPNFPSMREREV